MIKINFDDIQEIRKDLEKYGEGLEQKCDKLCEMTCELGRQEAVDNFEQALYSGINDATVRTEPIDDGYSVIAEGTSVLFIEYGTGINTAPHSVPKYARGGYGQHKGLQKGWVYYGEAGNNGSPSKSKSGKVYTKGDPANECMYQASEEMNDNVMRIAREVFKK